MAGNEERRCTAFREGLRFAAGSLAVVARAVKGAAQAGGGEGILVFDDATGRVVDLDLRGTLDDVADRYSPAPTQGVGHAPARGPGRPKLGVVGKEVTLLPRHWAWLGAQRGGASVTLRRLVEQARRSSTRADEVRQAQDAAYRFMQAVVGDEPGFEEATRALFAGDLSRFRAESEAWPTDLRDHGRRLAGPAFDATPEDRTVTDG